jgi:hypothetical protein
MLRMLLVGYLFGVRSERRLCEEVHLNLAYRWFCRLGLEGAVPDHSTFSKNRHGRFRESDIFRRVFEAVVRACAAAGLVDVEAIPARWSAEVAATKTMLERAQESLGLTPRTLAADAAYGSGLMLGWLMGRDVEPHIPILDRAHQTKGYFTRADFTFDAAANAFVCPTGKRLLNKGLVRDDGTMPYRASTKDCRDCALKVRCTKSSKRTAMRNLYEAEREHVRGLLGGTKKA